VADVPFSPEPDPEVENIRVDGFRITSARVEYDGLCRSCADKAAEKARR
jgi:Fe2+ or Zn2+ uptake regulation protein